MLKTDHIVYIRLKHLCYKYDFKQEVYEFDGRRYFKYR
jgi:hypothetical protein